MQGVGNEGERFQPIGMKAAVSIPAATFAVMVFCLVVGSAAAVEAPDITGREASKQQASGRAGAQEKTEAAAAAVKRQQRAETDGEGPDTSSASEGRTQRLDIVEYVVRGNTVLPPVEIQRVLSDYVGLDREITEVAKAREALEGLYRERGYLTVVVDVPRQDALDGVIELQVVEGKVGRLRVTGSDYYLPSKVKESVPEVQEGSVPNFEELKQQLAIANTRPGRTVTPVFRAGLAPGTVEVDLNVDDKRPWGLSVGLNNQYNQSTEELRLVGTAEYNNLFQRHHSANLQYQTAPQDTDQIRVLSGSYFFPLPRSTSNVVLYGVNSNTNVATIGGATVVGDGLTLGGRMVLPVSERDDPFVQSLLFGIDYKDFKDDIRLQSGALQQTPVTYLPFTGEYRGVYVGDGHLTDFSLGLTAGIDDLVGDQAEFEAKRPQADATFAYLFGGAAHQRRLTDKGVRLRLALDWQFAGRPLISNEQFALGGVQSVRGYRQAEVLGDRGARASVQLSFPVAGGSGAEITTSRGPDALNMFMFADAGYAELIDVAPSLQDDFTLAGIGLGFEFRLFNFLRGRSSFAVPLDSRPDDDSSQKVETDFGSVRAHFSITADY